MENKENKTIWDCASEFEQKFEPVPFKISLSLNDEYDTRLEYVYGFGHWVYSDCDRAVEDFCYDDIREFIDYVYMKFCVVDKKERDVFEYIINQLGLKNGFNDFISFFLISFYDTGDEHVKILQKYNFRIEYVKF